MRMSRKLRVPARKVTEEAKHSPRASSAAPATTTVSEAISNARSMGPTPDLGFILLAAAAGMASPLWTAARSRCRLQGDGQTTGPFPSSAQVRRAVSRIRCATGTSFFGGMHPRSPQKNLCGSSYCVVGVSIPRVAFDDVMRLFNQNSGCPSRLISGWFLPQIFISVGFHGRTLF